MFARDSKKLPVTLTLSDGRTMAGAVVAGLSSSIASALNRDGPFLEFISETGEMLYIGKTNIMIVREGAAAKTMDIPAISYEPAA